MARPDIPAAEREELLRRCWYTHDALWFRAVSDVFGIEVANRLNRAVLRHQGQVEARRLLRVLGRGPAQSLQDVVDLLNDGCSALLTTPPDIEARFVPLNDRVYEVTVERCFIHERIVRAGVAEQYECAAFDRFHGWHAGAGLPLAAEPDTEPCRKARGEPCVRRLAIRMEE